MQFLPKNYELPQAESNFFEFEDGENKFRIVSPCVTGWLWWENENGQVLSNPAKKCQVRYVRDLAEIPKSVQQDPNLRPKHFWSFVVFNHKTEQIQYCKITQTSIMRGIASYVNSPDWGTPINYSFVVTKEGDGLSTKYSVIALPMQPLDEGILALAKDTQIDLEAVFEGRDPFGEREEKQQVQPQPPNIGDQVRPPFQQTNGAAVISR